MSRTQRAMRDISPVMYRLYIVQHTNF